MGNFEKILDDEEFEGVLEKEITESFERMYQCLLVGDPVKIARKIGSKEPLERMIIHFSEIEEYEKCSFLSKILEKI